MQPPITVYHEEPEHSRFLEWREVWYCDGEEVSTYTLVEAHGWWDNDTRESSRITKRMLGRYQTESDAAKATDERIWWLRGKGWIYKRSAQYLFLGQKL